MRHDLWKRLGVTVLAVVFFVAMGTPSFAREHFRRVYRRSRTVVIRHQGRVKKVPTNAYYARYREKSLRTLPNWRVHQMENSRGIRYLWRITDDSTSLVVTPDGRYVSSRRPSPVEVRGIRVVDRTDNFHGRR